LATNSPLRPPDAEREPYLRIRRAGEGWSAEGQSTFGFKRWSPFQSQSNVAQNDLGWSWDGTTLESRNDRYGLVPLFYFERGGEIGISTSILRLLTLGAPPAFDYEAISVFLRLGCYLGCDTPFVSIRALPPGATLRWSEGKLDLTASMPAAVENDLDRPAALDGFIELFRQSIRRRSPEGAAFAVPLSGGRDSRHILFELCAQGHRPKECVTARYFSPGDTGNGEVEVAARIARAVGIPHRAVGPPASRFDAERRSHPLTNFCSLDAAWMFSLADALAGKVDLIYDGIGGDVLSAGLFLTAERLQRFRSRSLVQLANELLYDESEAPVFDASVRKELKRSVAIGRTVRELERHVDAPNPVGSFIFWNRTRRHIGSGNLSILARAVTVVTPYLDDDLFDFLSGLPAEMILDHSLHTEAIRLAYPQHATQPYSVRSTAVGRTMNDAAVRKYAQDSMRAGIRPGRTKLARRRFFLPRLFRCLVDRGYQASVNWLGTSFLYMIALESAADLGESSAD
jgi:asparagine synthase (glutamine-hydrolysing)